MAEDRSTATYIVAAATVLAALVGAGVLAIRSRSSSSEDRAALGEQQKAYLSQILVTDARMSAAENFLGDMATFLDARVTNRGPRPVRELEFQLVFVDTLNQVILRERTRPVNPRTRPLIPGETRQFRVSFDRLPADWNQAPPLITPTYVGF